MTKLNHPTVRLGASCIGVILGWVVLGEFFRESVEVLSAVVITCVILVIISAIRD